MSKNQPNTVMVVDDERSFTDLIGALIEEGLSCDVVTFTRPQEALDAFDPAKIAMVVTDYHMPQIDGLRFTQLLLDRAPQVPVLLITGHVVELRAAEKQGLTNLRKILHKPFGWRILASEIIAHWPTQPAPEFI